MKSPYYKYATTTPTQSLSAQGLERLWPSQVGLHLTRCPPQHQPKSAVENPMLQNLSAAYQDMTI